MRKFFERRRVDEYTIVAQMPERSFRNTMAVGILSRDEAEAYIQSDLMPEGATDFEILVHPDKIPTCTVGGVTNPFIWHGEDTDIDDLESLLCDARDGGKPDSTDMQKATRKFVAHLLDAAEVLDDSVLEKHVSTGERLLWDFAMATDFINATREAIGLAKAGVEQAANQTQTDTPVAKFRLTIESSLPLPEGHEPIDLPPMTLEQDETMWSRHLLCVGGHGEPLHLEPCLSREPGECWSDFIEGLFAADVSMFLCPGNGSIDLNGIVADAYAFQVFDVSSGKAELVGTALHRMEAMMMTKQLYREGRQPMVVSSHLNLDWEWDSEEVKTEAIK